MPSYIAALDLAQNPVRGRDNWRALAASAGLEVRQYVGQPRMQDIADFIRGASGLWLYTTVFIDIPGLNDLMHEAISRGARCFVEVNTNEMPAFNSFLDRYGLEATRMGLHTVLPGSRHPRLVRVKRSTHAEQFHDPILFEGVEEVLLQQAQVIRCRDTARSVLSVPLSDVEIVDVQRDLLHELDVPEVSVFGMNVDTERVLATSASCFGDTYRGPGGDEFPGIAANTSFASNLLRWLGGDKAPVALEDAAVAFDMIDRIERGLAHYLGAKLTRVHRDWWTEGVPESIRVDCAMRCERDRNLLERHCYLDLMHWKEIAGANWEHVEADWRKAGWSGNKKAGLGWFNELNAIRNVVMHPTKRAFGAEVLTSTQLLFLRGLRDQVDTLPR